VPLSQVWTVPKVSQHIPTGKCLLFQPLSQAVCCETIGTSHISVKTGRGGDGTRNVPNQSALSVPFVPFAFPALPRRSSLEAQPRQKIGARARGGNAARTNGWTCDLGELQLAGAFAARRKDRGRRPSPTLQVTEGGLP